MTGPRKPRRKKWDFTAKHLAAYSSDDPCRPFAELVANEPRRHNRWVHLMCRRHALDLIASADSAYPFSYDTRRAARPTAFAAQFRGLEGPLAGKRLAFLPWQRFCAAQIFGWRNRADPRRRRWRYVLVKVPRKNGKTGFVAPLGLLQLSHPPPFARCEVYSVATKEDIAKIVLKDAMRLVRTNNAWARRFRPRHKSLTHGKSDSEWKPLGSDSDTLDGLRPELVVMDELHAWRDRALWDVMNSAFGAAYSPLILQITTEGKDESGLLKEQEDRVCAVLQAVERGTYTGRHEGATADEGLYFGAIWQPDKGDRWDALETWHKANPSLGTVKELTEMQSLASGARSSAGARRDFLIKQLNVRQTTGPQRWLDVDNWDAGSAKARTQAACWERLRGLRVWGGLDLSATTDTSSACFIADDPDRPGAIIAAWLYWLPDDDLIGRVSRDRVPYDFWSREDWLSLCSGPVINIAQVELEIIARISEYDLQLQHLAYDPAYTQGAGQRLQDEHGLPMLQCAQRFSTMTAPLLELEKCVVSKLLDHGGNPIAASNVAHATVLKGQAGGILLAKARSTGRIDGLAGLGIAMAARLHSQAAANTGGGGLAFV